MSRETSVAGKERAGLDVARIRRDFPILRRRIHGHRLVYLDSAATSQKPRQVIEALVRVYERYNANVHRGIYTLSEEATEAYEATRRRVARFLGGVPWQGIVFTRGTTEAINLVAWAWARRYLTPGDEILLTEMEHHSNLVPWILVARETGARLRHVPVREDGTLDLQRYGELLTPRTKLVGVVHQSNVLGTVNPVAEMARMAHEAGAMILVDGAQSVPHQPVRIPELDCDFLAFSAHKMLGPTGVGVLWARPEILEEMEPLMGGGEMIREVHLERATWREIPWKHEAGTPNFADVIAFGAALEYLEGVGMERVAAHGRRLAAYAVKRLRELPTVRVLGPLEGDRGPVVSFVDRDVHPHDLATILDTRGIAIRAGHHCAQPLMRRFGLVATARASFYLYNDTEDVDALVEGIREARRYLGHEDA
jgi:cysteine desulfurase/selenocysteine lyase